MGMAQHMSFPRKPIAADRGSKSRLLVPSPSFRGERVRVRWVVTPLGAALLPPPPTLSPLKRGEREAGSAFVSANRKQAGVTQSLKDISA